MHRGKQGLPLGRHAGSCAGPCQYARPRCPAPETFTMSVTIGRPPRCPNADARRRALTPLSQELPVLVRSDAVAICHISPAMNRSQLLVLPATLDDCLVHFSGAEVWCDCRPKSASASETYTRSFRGRPEQARHGSQRPCHRAQPSTRPTCGDGSDLGRHWPFASASRRFATSPAATSGAAFPHVLRM